MLMQCPVCDNFNDLSTGHLEINSLLGEDAYVWLIRCPPRPPTRATLCAGAVQR